MNLKEANGSPKLEVKDREEDGMKDVKDVKAVKESTPRFAKGRVHSSPSSPFFLLSHSKSFDSLLPKAYHAFFR